jgi:small-conductance mechanosensitive channel
MNTTSAIQMTTQTLAGIEQEMVKDFSPIDVLYLLIAVIGAYIVGRLIAVFMKKRFAHKIRKGQLDILIVLVRIFIIIIGIGIVLPSFLRLSAFILIMIIIGVIVVLVISSQDVLSNFVSGLALYYEKPFRISDVLTTDAFFGTVEKFGVFSTTIQSNGSAVRIPNKDLFNKPFTNYRTYRARRYEYVFGIRYEDDADLAVRVLTERFDTETYVLKYPAPEVFVSDLTENSVNIKTRIWFPSVFTTKQDDLSLKLHILSRTRNALKEQGIEIAYPQKVIWFGNTEGRITTPLPDQNQDFPADTPVHQVNDDLRS